MKTWNKYTRNTYKEEDVHIAILFKLLGTAEALMDNFAWISPENLFDEASKPKKENKDDSQPHIIEIDCLCEKSIDDGKKGTVTHEDDDDLDFKNTWYLAFAPS